MVEIVPASIPGCFQILPRRFQDLRGDFVKVFEEDAFRMSGIRTEFKECFYSTSHHNVIRGMHFQVPPKDGAKLLYCVQGEVLDAVVDLRAGSPTFGKHEVFKLSAESATALYVPPGLAHGFLARSTTAIMLYHVTTAYSPEHDTGILWSSAGISWGIENPILSKRDQGFQALVDYKTPFVYSNSEDPFQC